MQSLSLDMVQYDCPYIETSRDFDVTFYTKHWDFHDSTHELETRIFVTSPDENELANGLSKLQEHPQILNIDLFKRQGSEAIIRSRIPETHAMRTIRGNGGYVTGPFVIEEGSEAWHIGFDKPENQSDALAELENHNEFSIEDELAIGIDEYYDIFRNARELRDLLAGLEDLTETEKSTLESALEAGYFTVPRETNLEDLADEFSISKMGVSINLRRSQRKALRQLVQAINDIKVYSDSEK